MDKSVTAVLTSAARTLQRRFEATANNIANLSTDGFRGQRSITSEHVASTGGASISMPRLGSALTLMRPGEVVPTQRSLDFAIEGPGFFLLETPEGGQVLSRAGAFSLDADGSLVASDGARVLDAGGAPIAIPPGPGGLNAASDGTLERDGAILGQIAIIAAPERPERLGAGRLAA
ncbi:MAG: flagellar hook-basal body complex protein, partial [Pseudomonadota bacterium]